jgi:hypothetical protein
MTRKGIVATAVGLSLGFSAPVYAQSAGQILKGTAIGAGGGALVGAIVPGVSVGTGAIIGGVGGAAYTALKKNKRYYHDRYGRRYYLNKSGRRVYR